MPLNDACVVDGCEMPPRNRGWCSKHYTRWLRHGDPTVALRIRRDDSARLWSKIDVRSPDECWPFTGPLTDSGYGRIGIGNGLKYTHRLAYEAVHGPIPAGLTLDHLCRNRACNNPAHLEPVTAVENVMRGMNPMAANARKTHCPHGHAYDSANTYVSRTGSRYCRECWRDRERRKRRAA